MLDTKAEDFSLIPGEVDTFSWVKEIESLNGPTVS